MNESLPVLLLQRSEGGEPSFLLGVPDLAAADMPAFERLLELGVVIHDRKLDVWDPCSDCTCGAEDRPIRWKDGMPYAKCPVSLADDEALDPAELQMFRISVARLADQVARALDIREPVEQVQPGLFCIGTLSGGRLVFLTTSAEVVRRPGAVDQIWTLARGQRGSLIAPSIGPTERHRLAGRGIDVVPPADAFLPSQGRRPVQMNLPALLATPKTAPRLALVAAIHSVTLDGCSVELNPRPFELLWLLAEATRKERPIVSTQHILRVMYAGSTAGESAVRGLKRDLQNALADLLKRAHFPGDLIETRTGQGYALALKADEVVLIPA